MADNPYDKYIPAETSNFSKNIEVESGGKQFDKSGNPLTSSAGAVGVAQIMPSTAPEAAEAAGEKYNPYSFKYDSQYNEKIGKAYKDKQLKTFGDEDKANAAYNAGPGATQKAIKKAETHGGDWKDYLPKETQDYIKKVKGAFSKPEPKIEDNPYLKYIPPKESESVDESNPYLKYIPSETKQRSEEHTSELQSH